MFQEQMILRIPGPTPVPPQVERAMARPMIGHRSGDFSELFAQTAERLKYVFQTEQDVYILAGSGTAGLEAAVANIVNPGDTVLVCTAGNFGDRFIKLAKSYGALVVTVTAEWGQAIDPQDVEAALLANPQIKAVFATHCETSTGVLHDIEGLGRVVGKTDALLVVDAVSSLGGADLPMDAWGLDVVVTGSQKALMLPTGLCFLSLSQKAWEVVEQTESVRFYFDLRAYRKQLAAKTTPYTPAVSLIFGLAEVMSMFEQEGLENRIVGDTLLVLLNAHHEPLSFTLPAIEWGADWDFVADTAAPGGAPRPHTPAGGKLDVAARSLVVLRRPAKE